MTEIDIDEKMYPKNFWATQTNHNARLIPIYLFFTLNWFNNNDSNNNKNSLETKLETY